MAKLIKICVLLAVLGLGIYSYSIYQTAGSRPLWYFVGNHSYKMAKVLLTLGADPNQCENLSGNCPLHTAVTLEDVAMIKILEKHGANINILNKYRHNVLTANCTSATMLDYFLNKKVDVNNQGLDKDGKPGFTALHCAVLSNKPAAVQLLVDYGASKKKGMVWEGKANVTPLQLAQMKGYKALFPLLK